MRDITMQNSKNYLSFPQTGLSEILINSLTHGNWALVSPQIHKDETMRNRKRVKEINQFMDHVQNELDNLDSGDILD